MYDKQAILGKICAKLAQEAENLTKGALHAHHYATDTESKSEGKYDTRGLEASYLAEGQAKLAAETHQAVAIYNALTLRNFAVGECIALTAIVELECDGERPLYFLGPKNGGVTIEHDGRLIVLITPTSPLGQMLIGKQVGDYFEMRIGGIVREVEVVAVQ